MILVLVFLKIKIFNINNIYDVSCIHKCAVKVNVVYIVIYFSMTYDIGNFIL